MYFIILVSGISLSVIVVEVLAASFIPSRSFYDFEKELGWAPKINFSVTKVEKDSEGNTYSVEATTNKYGFRFWGDTKTKKAKIFFIGDSFTGDPFVSDEDSYFGIVNEKLHVEVFAFGASGYGTLQELMILKKYIKIINPKCVVLQFCGNDFANNSYYIEGRSLVRNQKNLRPYFDGREIFYRLPDINWYKYLYQRLRIFRTVDHKIQKWQYQLYGDYYPPSYSKKDPIVKKARIRADEITEDLLNMMAESVSDDVKLYSFSCSTKQAVEKERWVKVVTNAGFIPLPTVSGAVEGAERKGIVVRAADGGHWSPKGHRIVGEELARLLSCLP
ncbi:SGNH/GDSL hydrolase family protein [Oligoflexia bacterium]|nr:SGNH/GDSL hydrolase family protein [Oligoflexia bacterium]